MSRIKNICVLGDGGWGTTLAILLSKKGANVSLWGAFPDYIAQLKGKRENIKFLPGVKIPEAVEITASMDEALEGREIVILAVPSQYMRGIVDMLKMYEIAGRTFVSVAKGIENKTLKRDRKSTRLNS